MVTRGHVAGQREGGVGRVSGPGKESRWDWGRVCRGRKFQLIAPKTQFLLLFSQKCHTWAPSQSCHMFIFSGTLLRADKKKKLPRSFASVKK